MAWGLAKPAFTIYVLAALAAVLLACGSPAEPLVIGDSIVHVVDFEDGWGRMTPDTAFVSAYHDFRLRDDVPGVAGRCACMEADNFTDAVRQWLVAEFRGEPGARYRVSLTWLSGPSGGLESAISAIGSVATVRPRVTETHSDFRVLGPIVPPPGEPRGVMAPFAMDTTITTGSSGRAWVAVGYQSGFESRAGTCVDDVTIAITRR